MMVETLLIESSELCEITERNIVQIIQCDLLINHQHAKLMILIMKKLHQNQFPACHSVAAFLQKASVGGTLVTSGTSPTTQRCSQNFSTSLRQNKIILKNQNYIDVQYELRTRFDRFKMQ